MSRPVPNPGILDIAPYTPGKSPVPEPGRKVFKLSANETPFGPSPKAMEAYKDAAAHLEDYPEGTSRVLREAIGRAFGLDPDRIICGAGSDEILNLLAHTYLSHGDEAISTAHGFLVYPIATMANGAKNVVAPETNFTADVDAILKLVTPRTKLVWLANPNNPTGTYLPFDEVKRLRAGLPPHVLLVLDAAYSDYVSRNDYELGIELVATTENTVMTHTFSKIHGLAALRIGWMFGPANIVDAVNRIRGPFNVSTPAMLAAVAAIEDTAHVQMSKAHTEKWRNWLTEEIGKLGLKVTPSVANFVLIHFPQEKGKTSAEADAFLTKRGLVLRALNNYGLPHALRMTIGTEEANRLVVDGLARLHGGQVSTRTALQTHRADRLRPDRRLDRARRARARARGRDRHHRALGEDPRAGDGTRHRRSRAWRPTRKPSRTPTSSSSAFPSAPAARSPQEIAPYLKPGAIVSDVGSVKGADRRATWRRICRKACTSCRRIPSPAPSIPVPTPASPNCSSTAGASSRRRKAPIPRRSKSCARSGPALGARVEIMTPDHHDLVLAITSHLPHLIAYTIVGTADELAQVTSSEVIKFSAGGFRDFTRIAASDPTMWRDVFLANKDAVLEMLGTFNEDLSKLTRAIRRGDGEALFEHFTRTRAIRRGIVEIGQDSAAPDFGRPHAQSGQEAGVRTEIVR